MHVHTLHFWKHSHAFAEHPVRAEKSTWIVMGITAGMMIIEVIAGIAFASMALLADGWHMATHVAAFGIAVFAYRFARTHADNPRFSFGTGKVGALGGFASAVALAVVALVMVTESVVRVFDPRAIRFNEAIGVALLGLMVNVACALVLRGHYHEGHAKGSHHHDQNLRAAYVHVIADALTSVLAMFALTTGKLLGWVWMDPMMGLVGAALITWWACGLVRDTGWILLDGSADAAAKSAIIGAIEGDADNRVADLHVWQVGPQHLAASIALVTHHPQPPAHYKDLLAEIPHLAHVTVEVNPCPGESCVTASA